MQRWLGLSAWKVWLRSKCSTLLFIFVHLSPCAKMWGIKQEVRGRALFGQWPTSSIYSREALKCFWSDPPPPRTHPLNTAAKSCDWSGWKVLTIQSKHNNSDLFQENKSDGYVPNNWSTAAIYRSLEDTNTKLLVHRTGARCVSTLLLYSDFFLLEETNAICCFYYHRPGVWVGTPPPTHTHTDDSQKCQHISHRQLLPHCRLHESSVASHWQDGGRLRTALIK